MADNTVSIPKVLGLPPEAFDCDASTYLREHAFPVARITPCTSQATFGATVFSAVSAWEDYNRILQLHGYDYPGSSDFLEVCFQADNFPADNFQNTYDQSFLEKVTSMVSGGVSDMAQMVGDLPTFAKDVTGAATGTPLEGMMEGFTKGVSDSANYINNAKNSSNNMTRNVANTMVAMASGGRVDFPMVWKNSSFTPSYSMTIRLYNPNPGNEESTQKYITGPLAALLILGCPQSPDGTVIKWPFLHKIKIPGIANVSPAFISNVSVIKGGDQQSIGWNQRLGICDVRIDFGSLFNSMIIETESKDMFGDKRPTLHNYLQPLSEERKVIKKHITSDEVSSLLNAASVSGIAPITKNIASMRNTISSNVPWVNPDNIVGNMGGVNPGKWVNPDGVANSPFISSVMGSSQSISNIPSIGSITNLVQGILPNLPSTVSSLTSMIPSIPNIPNISSLANMIPNSGNPLMNSLKSDVISSVSKLMPNIPGVSSIQNLDVRNSMNNARNITSKLQSPSTMASDTTTETSHRVSQEAASAANNTNWSI